MSQKMFGKSLITISKSKVKLALNKPAYVGRCVLDLNIVLIMNFIMIISKINIVKTQDCYSLRLRSFDV